MAAFFGLGLWWRGIRLGQEPPTYDDIQGSFRLGAVALIVCLLLSGVGGSGAGGALQGRLGGAVVGFFGAGLISLSLARLEAVRATSGIAADRSVSLNRDWLGILLPVVAALVIAALGLARIAAFNPLAALLGPLLDLIATLVWLIAIAIAIPIGLLLELVIYLIRLALRPGELPPPPEAPDLSDLERMRQEGGPVDVPIPLTIAIQWILLALIAGLAVFLLARAISRRRDRAGGEAIEEERESVWTPGQLREALLAQLRRLLTG